MNQKEIETLISIRKNLAILEEEGVKSQACPLPAEVCSLALVDLSLIRWQAREVKLWGHLERKDGRGGAKRKQEGEAEGVVRVQRVY